MRYNLIMTVRELLQPFLVQQELPSTVGATDHDLAHLEASLQVKLPQEVRDLYLQANGMALTSYLHLLPLQDVLELAQAMTSYEVPGPWGLVPIFDDGQSNPVCVACHPPLKSCLIRVPHDDVKQIVDRNVVSCLHRLVAAPNLGDDLEELPSPFAEPGREPQDAERAQALHAQADTLDELSRRDALRFAFTLLGRDGVEIMTAFLADADEEVRHSARAGLQQLAAHVPQAAVALQHANAERNRFAQECVRILKATGMTTTFERKPWGPVVHVEPGAVSLNLDVFWPDRTQPEFEERLVTRVRELQALKLKRPSR